MIVGDGEDDSDIEESRCNREFDSTEESTKLSEEARRNLRNGIRRECLHQ